jgi:Ohr subfamily peroxiredoxin
MPTYTAVATSSGRDGRATTSDGRLDLQLAMPKELGGSGEGTNPEQLFAVGYASCFGSALKLVARAKGLNADDATITAEVTLSKNPEGQGFVLAAVLRVALPAGLTPEQGTALVEAAHQVCPYSNATRGNMPVELVVEHS